MTGSQYGRDAQHTVLLRQRRGNAVLGLNAMEVASAQACAGTQPAIERWAEGLRLAEQVRT